MTNQGSGVCAGNCKKHISQWKPRYPYYVLSDLKRDEKGTTMLMAIMCKTDFDALPANEKAGWKEKTSEQ